MRRASLAATIALALTLAPEDASADDVVRYVVQRGDSCAAIARRFYGDSSMVAPIHDANDMRTPPPHSLRAGTVLLIPPRSVVLEGGPDATLTSVKNRVEVQAPEPRPGRVDDPLFRGNRVATAEISAASVTFRDETLVRLGERTLVVILGAPRWTGATQSSETSLVTGSLRAFMSGSRARATIATGGAHVRVIEGEASVSADARETTRLAVYDGNSTITAARVVREVPKGFGSKAPRGRAPTPPKPLPAAPEWAMLPAGVLFHRGVSAPLFVAEVEAPDEDDVRSFRMQLALDPSFAEPVVDQIVPRDVRRIEAHPERPGRYFVRVSAVDDDGFEGPFGHTASFGVVGVARTADGDGDVVRLEAPSLVCLRVGNVPLQRAAETFRVERGEAVFVRCGVSESAPTTLVRVD